MPVPQSPSHARCLCACSLPPPFSPERSAHDGAVRLGRGGRHRTQQRPRALRRGRRAEKTRVEGRNGRLGRGRVRHSWIRRNRLGRVDFVAWLQQLRVAEDAQRERAAVVPSDDAPERLRRQRAECKQQRTRVGGLERLWRRRQRLQKGRDSLVPTLVLGARRERAHHRLEQRFEHGRRPERHQVGEQLLAFGAVQQRRREAVLAHDRKERPKQLLPSLLALRTHHRRR
eukprot:4275690-Pleurochrysis_carterae.AAC.3